MKLQDYFDAGRIAGLRRMRPGYTLIELLPVIAIIAILMGLFLPTVDKIRETALKQFVKQRLESDFCPAMDAYFAKYHRYPSSIDDPAFTAIIDPSDTVLVPSSGQGNFDGYVASIVERYKQANFNVWLTVLPGTPGVPASWNFQIYIAYPYVADPHNYATKHEWVERLDETCAVTISYAGSPQLPLSRRVPNGALSQAARMSVSVFDNSPGLLFFGDSGVGITLLGAARSYVADPNTVSGAFNTLADKTGAITPASLDANPISSLFAQYYHTSGPFGAEIDAMVRVTPGDLDGDPAYLFSYAGLEQLSEFYSTKEGVKHALSVKLEAAMAAEQRGNLKEKAETLKAYRNQVSAQSGKALSADDAHVLTVLSMTL